MTMDEVYGLVSKNFIEEICAVDNPFIRQAAYLASEQAKQLKVVSFVIKDKVNNRGEIAQKGIHPSEKSVIDITKLTPLVDKQHRNLMEEIAHYRFMQMNFPDVYPDWWKENKEMLMIDYLLSASLCYVEVFDSSSHVDKFFATRNRFIAGALTGAQPHETAKYNSYLQTFSLNYQNRQLKVLKVAANKNGFRITQPRSYLDFNKSIKVTPLFLMTSFVEGVTDILKNHIVKFKYIKDNQTEREFISTLSPEILLRYYDTACVQKTMSGVGTFLNRGYIRLPELGISKHDASGVRALNISRITQLEIITEFDASYIDVYFDTILPTFKETVMTMRDPNILKMLHEDLTGQPANVYSVPELRNALVSFVDGQYALGTTTALRYLHKYMLSRKQFFPMYNGGKPVQYGSITSSSFNLGVSEEQ